MPKECKWKHAPGAATRTGAWWETLRECKNDPFSIKHRGQNPAVGLLL